MSWNFWSSCSLRTTTQECGRPARLRGCPLRSSCSGKVRSKSTSCCVVGGTATTAVVLVTALLMGKIFMVDEEDECETTTLIPSLSFPLVRAASPGRPGRDEQEPSGRSVPTSVATDHNENKTAASITTTKTACRSRHGGRPQQGVVVGYEEGEMIPAPPASHLQEHLQEEEVETTARDQRTPARTSRSTTECTSTEWFKNVRSRGTGTTATSPVVLTAQLLTKRSEMEARLNDDLEIKRNSGTSSKKSDEHDDTYSPGSAEPRQSQFLQSLQRSVSQSTYHSCLSARSCSSRTSFRGRDSASNDPSGQAVNKMKSLVMHNKPRVIGTAAAVAGDIEDLADELFEDPMELRPSSEPEEEDMDNHNVDGEEGDLFLFSSEDHIFNVTRPAGTADSPEDHVGQQLDDASSYFDRTEQERTEDQSSSEEMKNYEKLMHQVENRQAPVMLEEAHTTSLQESSRAAVFPATTHEDGGVGAVSVENHDEDQQPRVEVRAGDENNNEPRAASAHKQQVEDRARNEADFGFLVKGLDQLHLRVGDAEDDASDPSGGDQMHIDSRPERPMIFSGAESETTTRVSSGAGGGTVCNYIPSPDGDGKNDTPVVPGTEVLLSTDDLSSCDEHLPAAVASPSPPRTTPAGSRSTTGPRREEQGQQCENTASASTHLPGTNYTSSSSTSLTRRSRVSQLQICSSDLGSNNSSDTDTGTATANQGHQERELQEERELDQAVRKGTSSVEDVFNKHDHTTGSSSTSTSTQEATTTSRDEVHPVAGAAGGTACNKTLLNTSRTTSMGRSTGAAALTTTPRNYCNAEPPFGRNKSHCNHSSSCASPVSTVPTPSDARHPQEPAGGSSNINALSSNSKCKSSKLNQETKSVYHGSWQRVPGKGWVGRNALLGNKNDGRDEQDANYFLAGQTPTRFSSQQRTSPSRSLTKMLTSAPEQKQNNALKEDLRKLLAAQREKVDREGTTYSSTPAVRNVNRRLAGAGFAVPVNGVLAGNTSDSSSEYETDYSGEEDIDPNAGGKTAVGAGNHPHTTA
ncbi:unnamed protein product [Amoebophrya sp. A120]|nr:unnamed protein product [Amoebophrya sp. A120]|eukprot:GSA120T00000863001.1